MRDSRETVAEPGKVNIIQGVLSIPHLTKKKQKDMGSLTIRRSAKVGINQGNLVSTGSLDYVSTQSQLRTSPAKAKQSRIKFVSVVQWSRQLDKC